MSRLACNSRGEAGKLGGIRNIGTVYNHREYIALEHSSGVSKGAILNMHSTNG